MLLCSPSLSPPLNPHRISRNPQNPELCPKSIQISRLRTPSPQFRALICRSNQSKDAEIAAQSKSEEGEGVEENPNSDGDHVSVSIGNPSFPARIGIHRVSLGDQAFFLLAFIATTTSIAFASLVFAAVPALFAMKKAAISLAKLADTAREELPSTMAAVRLSGMEISDLTLELSDLSQEIADGVNKSAQAVQAAEAGIRQIGALARSRTMSMIEERANLPSISLQPVVLGAARKTSKAVGQAKKTFMNFISRGDDSTSDSGDESTDNVEY